MRNLSFALLLIFSTLCLTAQETPQEDLSHLFQDRDRIRKNAIKIDALSFHNGEANIFYERVVSPIISLEIGLGRYFWAPPEKSLALLMEANTKTTHKLEGATTLTARAKIFRTEAFNGIHRGFYFKYTDQNQFDIFDIGFEFGFQPVILNRIVTDVTLGWAYRMLTYVPGYLEEGAPQFGENYKEQKEGMVFILRGMLGYGF